MRKRAGLARALALDPELLILDEPTSGLDPISANMFDELIKSLRESLGLTVVMVTHDLDSLRAVCDRVAVLGSTNRSRPAPSKSLARTRMNVSRIIYPDRADARHWRPKSAKRRKEQAWKPRPIM